VFFFHGNRAATLALAGVLAGAAIVTRLATTVSLAGVLTLAIVLGTLRLCGFGIICHKPGPGSHPSGDGSQSDSELSAIHGKSP